MIKKSCQIFSYFLVGNFLFFSSCEQCTETIDKEEITISLSEGVSLVSFETSISFNSNTQFDGGYYSTGYINTDEEELKVKVKSEEIESLLVFEILQDNSMTINISNDDSCLDLSVKWVYQNVNNINACTNYNPIECP